MDFGSIFSGLGALSDTLFKSLLFAFSKDYRNKVTGAHLTGSEQEANAETEKLQEDAQSHDVDMANLNHQLSNQYFQQNLSIPAQVQQAQQAGLNPALMYSRGASVSSAPASFGSSSAGMGSSVSPNQSASADMFSTLSNSIIRAKEAEAQIKLASAHANEANAHADLIRRQFEYIEKDFKLRQEIQNKNIEDIDSKIAYRLSATQLNYAGIDEKEAHTALMNWQAQGQEIDNKYKDRLNESLLQLQEVSRQKSTAETKLLYAKTDTEKQKYKELVDSYDARMDQISADAYKALAEAGIKGYELEYWKDQKHLEAVAIQAGILRDTKMKGAFGLDYRPYNVNKALGVSGPGQPAILMSPYQVGIVNDSPAVSTSNILDLFNTYGTFSDKINKRKGWTKRVDDWRERTLNVGPL